MLLSGISAIGGAPTRWRVRCAGEHTHTSFEFEGPFEGAQRAWVAETKRIRTAELMKQIEGLDRIYGGPYNYDNPHDQSRSSTDAVHVPGRGTRSEVSPLPSKGTSAGSSLF